MPLRIKALSEANKPKAGGVGAAAKVFLGKVPQKTGFPGKTQEGGASCAFFRQKGKKGQKGIRQLKIP